VTGHAGLPATVTVPGELRLRYTASARAGDDGFYAVLSRGGVTRRIPFWVGVAVPRLERPTRVLTRTGTYAGSTVGRPSRVQRYRFPAIGPAQAGPEQVFRVRLRRPVANFGVVVLSGGVQPRVVRAGDQDRLVGMPGLPLNINPYMDAFGATRAIAGAIRPAAGMYDVVFDSRARGDRYTFRFWINDARPPTARLVSRTARGGTISVRVADAGAGVDPRSAAASVDGRSRSVRVSRGVARVDVAGLRSGAHELMLSVSDYQESKNMENVAGILPNTRVLRTTIRVP
jgi:hypothetical protein